MAERFAAMYPNEDSLVTVVSSVSIAEQSIEYGASAEETWQKVLWGLRDDLAAIRRILEAARRGHGSASGFQATETLMDEYGLAQADFEQGVHATAQYRLVPIALQDHHHKTRVFVRPSPAAQVASNPLSHALLEIGPTIAAQESDFQMARDIDALGRMRDPTLSTIMHERNYHEDDVTKIALDAQVLIETIRKNARNSIEFGDLASAVLPRDCDPIRVVLDCKLGKKGVSASSPSKFIELIGEFERLHTGYDGSPGGGEKLIRALGYVCTRASLVCTPLYANLELRMESTHRSISEYLRHPQSEVLTLLQEIRAPSHSSSPAPALWQKTL